MALSNRSRKFGVLSAALVVSVAALMLVYPVVASSISATRPNSQVYGPAASSSIRTASSQTVSTTTTSPGPIAYPQPTALTVGEQITFTSTQGEYRNLTMTPPPTANPKSGVSPTAVGQAAGVITFTVTGVLRNGYTLSLTSGSLSLGSVTIALTGGSAVMGPAQASIWGSGTAAGSGSMIFQGSSHSDFWGNSFNTFGLDLQSGGHEYLVQLLVTVSHS